MKVPDVQLSVGKPPNKMTYFSKFHIHSSWYTVLTRVPYPLYITASNMSPWNAVYSSYVFQTGAIHLNNQFCYDNLEGVMILAKQFYLFIGKLRYFLNFRDRINNNCLNLTTLIADTNNNNNPFNLTTLIAE